MTWTRKITLKCILKFKILQLIQRIVETDNNDVCVRYVEIKMQIVVFRTGVHFDLRRIEGINPTQNSFAITERVMSSPEVTSVERQAFVSSIHYPMHFSICFLLTEDGLIFLFYFFCSSKSFHITNFLKLKCYVQCVSQVISGFIYKNKTTF